LWAVGFFGLADLGVVARNSPGWESSVVLEASWGSLFTFLVAGADAAVAVRPRAVRAALVQLLVVAVALLVASLGGLDARPLPAAALVVANAVILWLLAGRPGPHGPGRSRPSWPLLVLAAVAAPVWVVQCLEALDASRRRAEPLDSVSWSIHHWPVHGAALLAIAVCAAVAAMWTEGRGLLGACTCCAATVIAAASLAHPDTFAVLPSTDVAFLAILWALAVGLIARGGQERRPQPDAGAGETGRELSAETVG
jgi:peptidoglycan/LPS O-acetylase OafA/YrhL